MGEIGEKINQKAEIGDGTRTANVQKSTIENTLKQKLPDNSEKQAFFLTLFNQENIQILFKEKDIIN